MFEERGVAVFGGDLGMGEEDGEEGGVDEVEDGEVALVEVS